MALQGARQLRRRLKAIKTVFKPVGKRWADETASLAKRYVPKRTGKTAASIRRKNASQKKATVQAVYTAQILSKGSKPHVIRPRKARAMKFNAGGRVVFTKKVNHRGHKGNDFARRAASDALDRNPMVQELIELWNGAA